MKKAVTSAFNFKNSLPTTAEWTKAFRLKNSLTPPRSTLGNPLVAGKLFFVCSKTILITK
jgi:hypothetical protein